MSGNSTFELVSERGWRRGLGNMLKSELARWWKTRMWWIQCLIWTGMLGVILSLILFSSDTPPGDDVAVLTSVFTGLIPAIGLVIIMQGVIVSEKKTGTAAWVLSKPLTRPAFILSKVIANSLGMLATMVILPASVAYTMYAVTTGSPWNPAGFLAALGVIFLSNFFFLSLTLMLGTFFNSRGPVVGIALALLLMQQNLIGLLPILGYMLPFNLIIPSGEQVNTIAPCLIIGCQSHSFITVFVVAMESILFILIGLYRFSREEL